MAAGPSKKKPSPGRRFERRDRRRADEFVVVGRRPVIEAIRSGRATRILAARGLHRTEGMNELVAEAARHGLQIETVDPPKLAAIGTADHQGVAAVVAPPEELDDRALKSMSFDRAALVVVLDGITDPQNFGACARAAEAAGASVLIARKRRSAPLTAAALKASAGALLHVSVARVTNVHRALEHLQHEGFFVVGLDHTAGTTIHDAEPPPHPLALVVGAEDVGMSRLVREACDLLVSIPMSGRTQSLNAAAALAVGLFGYAVRPDQPRS